MNSTSQDVGSPGTESTRAELSSKEQGLKNLHSWYKNLAFASRTLAIVLLAVISLIYLSKDLHPPIQYIFLTVFGVLILLVFPLTFPTQLIQTQLQQTQNEIDLLSIEDTNIEKRAEKLFKNHQFELKRYYDQTLRHTHIIFLTGLLCIVAGFVFIAVTFLLINNKKGIEFNEKILIGAIGTISTFFANFIGAIYLKMYAGTIKSLTEFHNRLVNTHHLHFGNFLLSKISDKELREKTIGELALKILDSKSP